MVFPRGAWSTNAVTKEIAAPIRLNGSHFLIARSYLSKLYTYHDSKLELIYVVKSDKTFVCV